MDADHAIRINLVRTGSHEFYVEFHETTSVIDSYENRDYTTASIW